MRFACVLVMYSLVDLNVCVMCFYKGVSEISGSYVSLNQVRVVLLVFIVRGRGVYCSYSCVCDAVRKHTVFNGNSPPSRIFSS